MQNVSFFFFSKTKQVLSYQVRFKNGPNYMQKHKLSVWDLKLSWEGKPCICAQFVDYFVILISLNV